MAIGVRVEPELEQRLDRLARSIGKCRSACVREAIAQYVQRFGDDDEARHQSALIAPQPSTCCVLRAFSRSEPA